MSLPDPSDTFVGRIYFDSTLKNNRNIRSLFLKNDVSIPHAVSKWNSLVENILWKKVCTLPNKYLLVNKVKEISFKLLHQYYPVKTFIVSRFKLNIDVNCTFCYSQPETVLHLFWYCDYTRKLWQDICQFIIKFIHNYFELYFKNVLFGLYNFEKQDKNVHFLCNLIILLAKYFIHKCKTMKVTPHFSHFQEVKIYIKSLFTTCNKKATKTLDICSLVGVFL